jgi:pilus assembly protein Flp/PilA
MDKMTLASKTLVKDTRGANLVEYILLVGLIAIVAMVGFQKFGKSVNDKVKSQAGQVDGIPG